MLAAPSRFVDALKPVLQVTVNCSPYWTDCVDPDGCPSVSMESCQSQRMIVHVRSWDSKLQYPHLLLYTNELLQEVLLTEDEAALYPNTQEIS